MLGEVGAVGFLLFEHAERTEKTGTVADIVAEVVLGQLEHVLEQNVALGKSLDKELGGECEDLQFDNVFLVHKGLGEQTEHIRRVLGDGLRVLTNEPLGDVAGEYKIMCDKKRTR